MEDPRVVVVEIGEEGMEEEGDEGEEPLDGEDGSAIIESLVGTDE